MMPIKPSARPPRGVRYVDVRLAIPDGAPFPSGKAVAGYLRSAIPLLPTSKTALSASSCTFIPLAPNDTKVNGRECFSPPVSPLDYRKAALSPALTATTLDSSSHTLSSCRSVMLGAVSPLTTFEGEICTPTKFQKATPLSSVSSSSPTLCKTQDSKRRRAKSPFHGDSGQDSRKQRVKTELCMHWKRGTPCPFGENCTFAHGEEELQKKRLVDLRDDGIDIETYRTKPCLMWVSAGSCPYGQRCHSLHDKRVASDLSSSWLPHAVTQGNSLETDIFVESQYHKRLFSLLKNPFGGHFSRNDDWRRRICNLTQIGNRKSSLSQFHKVDIALQMRGPPKGFVFKPQHVIHGTLCMVLQKRTFLLAGAGATEPPLSSYDPDSRNQVMVYELAFGPCGSDWGYSSVRPVGIYFNINEDDCITCTPQQAKRYRWKPNNKKNAKEEHNSDIDSLDFFEMVRPFSPEAYDLATRVLRCHLEELRTEAFPLLDPLAQIKAQEEAVALEMLELKELIHKHMAHWKKSSWPINEGREHFDEETPVPPVDAEYKPNSGCAVMWESFLCNLSDPETEATPEKNVLELGKQKKKRLSIFQRLAEGEGIVLDRTLPHITKASKATQENDRSERCWKSLLLEQADGESSEWDIIKEHFEKSRSKKTLAIVQH